jgi:5-aminolevulinate synthase
VRHLKESDAERARHQERAATLKRRLVEAGLPVMASESHIVPVLVGDPVLCKRVTDTLMSRQPLHSDQDVDRLIAALSEIWAEFGLERAA